MCDVLTSALRADHRGDGDVKPLEMAPHYYGGQAVIEGVMMRGADSWAVAVRRPNQDIYLERHATSDMPKRYPVLTKPMIRGVYALVDSLSIGMKALGISAEQSLADEDGETEELHGAAMGASMLLALLIFVGIFIVLPSAGLSAFDSWLLGDRLGDGAVFHLIESFLRIIIFLMYLSAISLIADIRRVFEYHGAEHKTISAWEHHDNLAPADVDKYSTIHVRCGTNFLVLVMVLALIVYTLVGTLVPAPDSGLLASIIYHVALRVVLLPVVAGLAYESLRLGAEKYDLAIVRWLMQPGLWLQRITTKQPAGDQLEVAIRAFEAVVPSEALGDKVDQSALPSRVIHGHSDDDPLSLHEPLPGLPEVDEEAYDATHRATGGGDESASVVDA